MKTTSPGFQTIEEYIELFDGLTKERLLLLQSLIKLHAPLAKEMINYQIPTFEYYGNLVHFAAFSKHIGFYPGSSGVEAFEASLQPYKHAKGSIQFLLSQEMPWDLIARIVLFRVQENEQRMEMKRDHSTTK
ncbi:MAG: DUF1801 domain-containing protein [Candidatus Izemoplasmatales bacterium]|nr:DUF1801 domain-containing protein [bacterium]MDZ4196644.1 DUF1801 domain-containing protein [Candidatus Izemoplasmatales bacterium]